MTQKQKKQSFKTTLINLPAIIIAHLVSVYFLLKSSFVFLFSSYLIFTIICIAFYMRYRKKVNLLEIGKQDLFEKNNLLNESIRKEEALSSALTKKNVRYASLKEVLDEFNQILNLGELGRAIIQEADTLFSDSDNVILYLMNRQTNKLELLSSKKVKPNLIMKEKCGDLLDEWVLRHTRVLLVEDTSKDFRFDPDRIRNEISRPLGSVISTPLISVSRFVGILRLESNRPGAFSFEDLRLLSAIGSLVAVSLENSLLYANTEELAIRDGLTGLYLRRYIDERGQEKVSYASRRKSEMSILMVDIDYFKRCNDSFGHHLGDIVLTHIADLLKGIFQKRDCVVSRYGGEEFVVLLPNTKKSDAVQMAENLRKSIQDGVIFLRRAPIKITVSIGVAGYPKDADDWKSLVKYSDNAMYKAKQQGRNRVCS
ncbi:GGDEF domain-containing protein [Thermoproteota archaeon]